MISLPLRHIIANEMDKRQIAAVDIFSSVLLLGKLHVVNGLY
jgi:hypothetical protein